MKKIDRICNKICKSQEKGRRKRNNMQGIGMTIFQSESLKAIIVKGNKLNGQMKTNYKTMNYCNI